MIFLNISTESRSCKAAGLLVDKEIEFINPEGLLL